MNDDLLAIGELGEEARAFLNSNLGTKLIQKAMDGIAHAQEALEEVDPADTKRIVELQNLAWRCRSFGGWLQQFVTDGDQAISVFKQQTME